MKNGIEEGQERKRLDLERLASGDTFKDMEGRFFIKSDEGHVVNLRCGSEYDLDDIDGDRKVELKFVLDE
jgi:hypothetical protein